MTQVTIDRATLRMGKH